MPNNYTPTVWATGDVVTATKANNWETQYSAGLIPRVTSVASSATPAPDADTDDVYELTALAVNATFTNPSGATPNDEQRMLIKVKDNGVARTLAWGTAYANGGTPLPTVTTAGKVMRIGLMYDAASAKWGCVAAQVSA